MKSNNPPRRFLWLAAWLGLLGLPALPALAVDGLRLGPLPTSREVLWAKQLPAASAPTPRVDSPTHRPGPSADFSPDSLRRIAAWDDSPRGQSNLWRLTLLEMVERHEAKARRHDDGILHRLIALQALAEFAERFPRDRMLPEVLLHQAFLLRDARLPQLAVDKLYAVLRALPLAGGSDLEYLRLLTLITQGSIADLHAELGQPAEAAALYGRLLASGIRQNPPGVVAVRRLELLEQAGSDRLLVEGARSLLAEALDPALEAETRGRLALASLRMGDTAEASRQMQVVLESHRAAGSRGQAAWLPWRLRLGNAAANYLFQKADYANARTLYERLAGEVSQPFFRWQAENLAAVCEERQGRLGSAREILHRMLADPLLNPGRSEQPEVEAIRQAIRFRSEALDRQALLESQLMAALGSPQNGPRPTP